MSTNPSPNSVRRDEAKHGPGPIGAVGAPNGGGSAPAASPEFPAAVESARRQFSRLKLLIGGAWVDGGEGAAEDVLDPATGVSLGRVPHACAADLQRALAAAEDGYAVWSRTPAIERRRVLMQAAALIRERQELIACMLTLEQGKPLAEARGEVTGAAEIFEWYAEETRRLYGRVIPARNDTTQQLVVQQPVGPVAAFTPWNFPALTPARKIAGALAAGCSCIIKPAEETPGTAIELARACMDAGLPAGVLNVVFGVPSEISEFLIRAPQIRKITFTGSIAVGKHLAALAAKHGLKRCTMELGGHAPVLVFDDASVEKAAQACAAFKFRNAGQVCIAPSRFYVQRGAYERFVEVFTRTAAGLRLGAGTDASTTMGPLANDRRLAAMAGFVDDAAARGGRVLTGGARAEGPGFFWQPTVLTELPDEAKAMREETFGPVAPIARFDTLEEVLQRANSLPYGLAAYAFSNSAATMMALSAGLEAGMVGVNSFAVSLTEAPFGGIKESGYGSEGGVEGLGAYLITKFVAQASF